MTPSNAGAATITARRDTGINGENAPARTIVGPFIPLLDVPSACPDEANRVGKRIDPYWADLWPVGSKASWVDVGSAKAQVAAGIGRRT